MQKKLALIISKFLIFFIKLRHGRRVKFGKNVILNHKFKLKGKGQLIIENNCNLWAFAEPNSFHTYSPEAQIVIKSGTRLNGVTCHAHTLIQIGSDCLVGSATIIDTDFHTFDDPDHILYGKELSKPIYIGDKVWLGGQSVILKGCQISHGSVVGFRSVVTKSFPHQVVVAGNPAKIVKTKDS
jgi:acetyltransferase-like isoleucine patch superfamily enzyme